MNFGENSPAITLARQGMHLEQVVHEEHRRRGVTDLTTLMLCQRHARQFLQRRTPVETPATVLGHILHRTIKHLYDRYRVEQRTGQTGWLPGDAEVREECQIAEEAKRRTNPGMALAGIGDRRTLPYQWSMGPTCA